jgi:hypothetical protein
VEIGGEAMSAVEDDHEGLRPEPPTTYYEGVVELPGYGDAPNRCRPMKPVGFCDHGHTVLGRSSCGTRYCPDHWRDWCEDAVVNMVAQLAAYRYAQPMGTKKRLCHVVASPPQDRRYSARSMWDTRSEAYEALEAAGVRGGATVTHPFRTNDRGDQLYQMAKEKGDLDEDTGKWRFLREVSDDFEDLTRYIEAEPHYHALAAVEDVQSENAPEGWIVERIRTFDAFHPKDEEAYRDMASAAYYTLTHGANQEGRSTTTYFGDVHSFTPSEELTTKMWKRIQIEAEKAVKEVEEEEVEAEDEAVSAGPEECPHDECEATVHDVYYLKEYLDDDDWVASVRATVDGLDRLRRLRGVLYWWDEGADRPPPGALTSEARMREWLEEKGDLLTPGFQQVGLETAIMGG